jgi:hypothetical protein
VQLVDGVRDDSTPSYERGSAQSELLVGGAWRDAEAGVDGCLRGEGASEALGDQSMDHVEVVGAHQDLWLEADRAARPAEYPV